MNFEFETNEDMSAALTLLTKFLDSSLSVNVQWDERKKRFRKKKTARSRAREFNARLQK
jgi:hypothetical protein